MNPKRTVRHFSSRPISTLILATLAAFGTTQAASAQFSRPRADYEKVRSQQGYVNLDRDRAEQAPIAKNLYDACNTLVDSLANTGRELSEFGSNFADERSRIRRAAANLRGQAEVTRGAVDSWMRKLGTTENHKNDGERAIAQLNELSKQWTELTRRIDETRAWVTEGLRLATRDKDRITQDSKPIQDAQNAAWARLQTAQRSAKRADEEHDRAIERVVASEARENESYERYCAATVASGGRTEETAALRANWARAVAEEQEALATSYTAHQAAQTAREEVNRAYAQLATSQREMRAFAAATDANRIVENYNFFVKWNELFAREFN